MIILPFGPGLICTVLSFSNPASRFLSGKVIVPSLSTVEPPGNLIGVPVPLSGITVPP